MSIKAQVRSQPEACGQICLILASLIQTGFAYLVTLEIKMTCAKGRFQDVLLEIDLDVALDALVLIISEIRNVSLAAINPKNLNIALNLTLFQYVLNAKQEHHWFV